MRILITGATGFIGRHLAKRLKDDGHEVVALSRDGERAARQLGIETHTWLSASEDLPATALSGVDAVVHLMGENIGGGRWSAAFKQRARDSRIASAEKLVAACPSSVKTFVSASAIGYYPGHRADLRDTVFDESYPVGDTDDFMQRLVMDWEAAVAAAGEKGIRTVSLRIGLVMGPGGLLAKLGPLFRLGLGGPIGDGRQWMPWIHVDDVVGIILAALSDSRYQGAINAVSPAPVRYGDFARALGRVVHRPAILPVPAIALKLVLGEAAALALNSYRVVPKRLMEELAFAFEYPELDTALGDALSRGG